MQNKTDKISICHVITRMIVGGAQENTLFSCIGQLRAGHRVVLVTGPSPGPEGELLSRISVPELEVVVMEDLVREISPKHDWRAYRKLSGYFRRQKFDVVHTHSSKAGLIGRLAAHKAKVPCIVHTVHGQAFHAYEKAWKNFIYKTSERMAARRSDRIFAVAQAMIDQCVSAKIAPAKKYKVVYSGMDMESFLTAQRENALRESLQIPSDAPVIGTLARLFELKGYEDVMQAFPLVLKAVPQAHLLIVGDGILREKLEKAAHDGKFADRVHFAGLVSPDQVPRYLTQMNVLWHLSLREGLPRSVVQALACGIPACGYALDGTPEVIFDRQTGCCVPAGDFRTIASRTVELLLDPDLAASQGAAGRKLVKTRFDKDRMAAILLDEYIDILKGKNCL
ncbi:MAG: glycosyltransferase family 4 protein [Lentisphaerae bacterium]|nr:glycosyltransferase family 4 protein [Lentisphaerota bacterium]